MKPLVVYTYKKCSTCRKAVKWLEAEGIVSKKNRSAKRRQPKLS